MVLLTRNQTGSDIDRRIVEIVRLRDEGYLLREIADQMGVTKERVRQILAKARALGTETKPPKQVVTRQASILLGMSSEMRPGSFQRLMARFDIAPVANKKGRLYWNVETLLNIQPPECIVCQNPIPLPRYTRSTTCSRTCSNYRRSRKTAKAS